MERKKTLKKFSEKGVEWGSEKKKEEGFYGKKTLFSRGRGGTKSDFVEAGDNSFFICFFYKWSRVRVKDTNIN